jgi:hypothetical protein
MTGGILHVPQRDPGIERRRHEAVAHAMREFADVDACLVGESAHESPCRWLVHPPPVLGDEDRACRAFADVVLGLAVLDWLTKSNLV